jgi:hypothetical protein
MKKKTTPTKTSSRIAKAPVKSRATALKSKATTTKKARKSPVVAKSVARKGIRHHAKRLYHLTPKFIHGMVVGAFIGIVVLVPLGNISQTSALAISTGKDCDDYSIIRCGVTSTGDLLARYRASSYVQAAYANMNISGADITNMGTTAVAGTVYDDGTVYLGSQKLAKNEVAKDVRTEARLRVTNGDQKESLNNHTFYKRSLASSWTHKSAAAYVVMKNNVFQFAILAPCGNPIKGTPTTSPPPPPPQVPNILVCDLTTKTMVTIKKTAFNTTRYSKNAADCRVPSIKVCDLTTLKVISIKENAFNSSIHTKNLAACTPPVGTIVVCDLATKTMITITKDTFDATKHSKDSAPCQPPTPVELTTTTLPNTGPGAVLIIGGLAILGGYVFHMRHRHVQHKKHATHHTR